MSSHTSSVGSEQTDPDPVLTFRPRLLPDGSTAPNPVEAEQHFTYSAERLSEGPGKLMTNLTEYSIPIGDAMKTGWVLYYPEPTTVATTEEGTPAISGSTETLQATDIAHDLFLLDTMWSAKIPAETVLRAYPPFNHAPGGVISTVPSVVARRGTDNESNESGFVPIQIPVRIDRAGNITTNTQCAQLVLTRDIEPAVPHEQLTTERKDEVEKQDRAMDLYPGWYDHHNASDER